MGSINYSIDKDSGMYFLRTNVTTFDEKKTRNLAYVIECENRQVKTVLNLRLIFYQTDDNAYAHLYPGIQSY
ncbi:MAG: hypothetical protein IKP81_09730 [Paludibacteraceae bacterium]|nr:hypothetical protein [Paludibacteraceae bacterium]